MEACAKGERGERRAGKKREGKERRERREGAFVVLRSPLSPRSLLLCRSLAMSLSVFPRGCCPSWLCHMLWNGNHTESLWQFFVFVHVFIIMSPLYCCLFGNMRDCGYRDCCVMLKANTVGWKEKEERKREENGKKGRRPFVHTLSSLTSQLSPLASPPFLSRPSIHRPQRPVQPLSPILPHRSSLVDAGVCQCCAHRLHQHGRLR